ncbi:MAG: hypothetical protein M3P29_00245, partial [Acidobacteriota bacterium]|nr:hypothetical protein [Acidobacteriota bacterium]
MVLALSVIVPPAQSVGVVVLATGAVHVTVKVPPDADPAGVVTLTEPLPAPAGAIAVICVSLLIVNDVALTPLNFTAVAPVKALPPIVTLVPARPLAGLMDDTSGGGMIVKLVVLDPVPASVITEIGPDVAPAGTVATICVSLDTVYVEALMPLNFTAVAPVKPEPVTVTDVPAAPLEGVKEVIEGGAVTLKLPALLPVPDAVVTLTGPMPAPAGAIAVICVSLSTVNDVALTPLNFTAVAPVKALPPIVTLVPAGPLAGLMDDTSGGGMIVKLVLLVPVPADVVTLIGPVVAPLGTTAVRDVSLLTVYVATEPLNF